MDWRFDPFSKQYIPQQIVNETYTIQYDAVYNRYIIKLKYIPLYGYTFQVYSVSENLYYTETINSPSPHEFRVDYEDITNPNYTGTGIIEFNANDNNKTMQITYYAVGEYLTNFTNLKDTPSSYAGKKLQFLNVNNDETGIDFAKSDILLFHKKDSNALIDISNAINISIPSIYDVRKAKIQMVVSKITNVNYGYFIVYASINNMVNYDHKYYVHNFETTDNWNTKNIWTFNNAYIISYINLLIIEKNYGGANERSVISSINNVYIHNNYLISSINEYREMINLDSTGEAIKRTVFLTNEFSRNFPDTNITNISIFTNSSQTIDYELWVYITPTFT